MYQSALALTLTLPDICGQVEMPSARVGARYKSWFDQYVAPLYMPKYIADIAAPQKRIIDGSVYEMLFDRQIMTAESKIYAGNNSFMPLAMRSLHPTGSGPQIVGLNLPRSSLKSISLGIYPGSGFTMNMQHSTQLKKQLDFVSLVNPVIILLFRAFIRKTLSVQPRKPGISG